MRWDSPLSAHKKRWGVSLPSTLKCALKMLILQFPHRAQNCRYIASFVVLLVPAFCFCLQCFYFGFFAHLLTYVVRYYESIFGKHYKRIAVHYIVYVFSHTLLFVIVGAIRPHMLHIIKLRPILQALPIVWSFLPLSLARLAFSFPRLFLRRNLQQSAIPPLWLLLP